MFKKQKFGKNYKGKAFEWSLEVRDVSNEIISDGFTVQFKCENSNALASDILMTYPKTAKDVVLKLEIGSFYKVKGLLIDYSSFAGLQAIGLPERSVK